MKRWKLIAYILLVLAQGAALAQIVHERETLLSDGTPVRLQVVPVDPRSLLSGDYVILNFKINFFPGDTLRDMAPELEVRSGQAVFVALEPRQSATLSEAAGTYFAVAVAARQADLGEARYVIRGQALNDYGKSDDYGLNLSYGIENYFVPQFAGLVIEESLARTEAEVMLGPQGDAALKRLFIDGEEVVFE